MGLFFFQPAYLLYGLHLNLYSNPIGGATVAAG